MIAILVAFDKNRVIGDQGKLPWHISEDLRLFKQRTLGQVVIMGARTFETLPPNGLPGRLNIVLHRPPSPLPNLPFVGHTTADEGVVHLWDDLEYAIKFAKVWGITNQGRNVDVFIIGGGQIYKAAMESNLVNKIIVSRVHGEHNGDVCFPYISPDEWREFMAIEQRYEEFDMVEYERR